MDGFERRLTDNRLHNVQLQLTGFAAIVTVVSLPMTLKHARFYDFRYYRVHFGWHGARLQFRQVDLVQAGTGPERERRSLQILDILAFTARRFSALCEPQHIRATVRCRLNQIFSRNTGETGDFSQFFFTASGEYSFGVFRPIFPDCRCAKVDFQQQLKQYARCFSLLLSAGC